MGKRRQVLTGGRFVLLRKTAYLYSMYLVKTSWWLRALYPTLTWRAKTKEKVIYLTFDDGPHETATPFVLEQLRKYQAKAVFFCIGKNVSAHPGIYHQILAEGHVTGNHTYNHVNGWKTGNKTYWEEIQQTAKLVKSNLFRPPYGRIRHSQIKQLQTATPKLQIIMWDVLSADFDTKITGETCLNNVIKHAEPGSIVLFHDSEKAFQRMQYALPKVLEYFSKRGYRFEAIADQ